MGFSQITIVLPASQKDSANAWMKANVDPQGGENTFSVSYSDNGKEITHYVSIGQWTPEQAADLEAKFGTKAYDGDPQEVLNTLKLNPFLA